MGWLVLAALSAATLFALWKTGRLSRAALELTAAALSIAIAGYAWQGSPDMAGRPTAQAAVRLP